MKSMDNRYAERGNALIYVLIAIALFAALSFTLTRQAKDGDIRGELSKDKVEIYVGQLISYASQAKNSVDQLLFEGAQIDELDFINPSDSAFETGSDIKKVYHPGGAGLSPGTIPEQIINEVNTNPAAGWYMGRFNNVEWTDTSEDDVMLTAHQISREACELINEKVTGSTAIPTATVELHTILIDESEHSGSNVEFTKTICADCEDIPSLCISNPGATIFSFYNIIEEQ